MLLRRAECKCGGTDDDDNHGFGNIVNAPERAMNMALEQLGRVVAACADHPVYVIGPFTKYIFMPCCKSPDHITNFASYDYVKSLLTDQEEFTRG